MLLLFCRTLAYTTYIFFVPVAAAGWVDLADLATLLMGRARALAATHCKPTRTHVHLILITLAKNV